MAWTANQRLIVSSVTGLTTLISGSLLGIYLSSATRLTIVEQEQIKIHSSIENLENAADAVVALHHDFQRMTGAVSTMQVTAGAVGSNAANAIKTSEAAIDIMRGFESQIAAAQDLMKQEVRRSVQMTDLLDARLREMKETLSAGMSDRFRGVDYQREKELWNAKFMHLREKVDALAARLDRIKLRMDE